MYNESKHLMVVISSTIDRNSMSNVAVKACLVVTHWQLSSLAPPSLRHL